MLIDDHVDGNKAGQESELPKSQGSSGNAVDIVRTIGKLPINPTAKLVAITMRTTRVVDSKTLSEMLGLSMRVIQKSKNEYATASDECGESSEPGFANRTNPANQDSLSPAPRVHAPAQMESPSGIDSSKEVEDTPFTPTTDIWGRPAFGEKDVHFDGANLILTEAERADWLPKFGNAERLDLALTQAAAFVQVNSRRPLLVQVRAQLARSAGDKIDRDQRYAKAASVKPTAQASPSRKTWADDRNDKARAFLALLKPTEATQ